MSANDTKSYLGYLNKLEDEYSNTYYHSVDKKPIDAYYSAFSEETETNPKAPKFKVGDRVRITEHMSIFSKGYIKKWSRKIFVISPMLKTNPWMYKIKDLSREKKK